MTNRSSWNGGSRTNVPRRSRTRRRTGGRGSFAVWMLVTVGLLVPTQWFAYRQATRPAADQRFPISTWSDPRYFSTAVHARTVQPLLRRIIDEITATGPARARLDDAGPTSSPSPSPSVTRTPSPDPTTPSPSPTGSPAPSPRPSEPPDVEIRADPIAAPDGSGDLFYRWRLQIDNPSEGAWLDAVRTFTQVPMGMERVECERGLQFEAGSRPRVSAQGPVVSCRVLAPDPSEDGHDLAWTEAELGPGHVRVYSFEVRVTAGNGKQIRNHAHMQWSQGSIVTGTCQFVIVRSAPKTCRATSA